MEQIHTNSGNIHAYMLCSVNHYFWNKLGVNPSPFHVSTRLRLTLAVVARAATCRL